MWLHIKFLDTLGAEELNVVKFSRVIVIILANLEVIMNIQLECL